MPAFGRPKPTYDYNLSDEIQNLDLLFTNRNVPQGNQPSKLLLASWNIANLGDQKRSDNDLKLIAHILSRFDLIAVQEVKGNYLNFKKVVDFMNGGFKFIFSDTAGNNERLAFVYRENKVKLGELFAEVAIPSKDYIKKTVVVPWTFRREKRAETFYDQIFTAFDRNPFVGTFSCENLDFMIANVHLYYGAKRNSKTSEDRAKYVRRVLEVYTLSNWAKKRARSKSSYDNDIILVGDMNIPEMKKNDFAYKALKSSGLQPVNFYSNTGGSNLNNDKTYDQLAMTPGNLKNRIVRQDVFDFDNGIFRDLWDTAEIERPKKPAVYFNKYMRAYVSDHRPLWLQLDVE
ncbi:MAG: endonuclease/exonuclease/phosphatase family protein [Flavobacteriales bacterium]|nr:endonuclease/exonuclease/phosphatase family protein [Flavobacteriales bacterium]